MSEVNSSVAPLRRALARLTGVGLVATAAIVLSGCHAPPRLGVATTVMAITGNCDTSAVVEIGAALPLSGSLARLGRAELDGLKYGVERVNGSGGVLGSHRCLELMYKDDRSSPAVDDQALLDLVNEEHVSVVVGPFLAADDAAADAHLGSLGVTAMSFSEVDPTFDPHGYPYTYPVGSSITSQARLLAKYVEHRGWKKVSIVDSGSVGGTEAAQAFLTALRGSHTSAATGFTQPVDSLRSASRVLSHVKATAVEALVVFDDGSTLGPVLASRRALALSIPVVAATETTFPSVPGADLSGVEAVVPGVLVTGRSSSTGLESFRERLEGSLHQTNLGGVLTPYAQGYDAVEMFASAVTGVDADDPGSLRTYIENANFDGLLGSYSYTSGDHEGISGSQDTVVGLRSVLHGT